MTTGCSCEPRRSKRHRGRGNGHRRVRRCHARHRALIVVLARGIRRRLLTAEAFDAPRFAAREIARGNPGSGRHRSQEARRASLRGVGALRGRILDGDRDHRTSRQRSSSSNEVEAASTARTEGDRSSTSEAQRLPAAGALS